MDLAPFLKIVQLQLIANDRRQLKTIIERHNYKSQLNDSRKVQLQIIVNYKNDSSDARQSMNMSNELQK